MRVDISYIYIELVAKIPAQFLFTEVTERNMHLCFILFFMLAAKEEISLGSFHFLLLAFLVCFDFVVILFTDYRPSGRLF